MKNILIGVEHQKGDFKDNATRKQVVFDNIILYFANFNHRGVEGFSFSKGDEPIKIKTQFFEDITGIAPAEFLDAWKEKYQLRRARILSEVDDWGKFVVESLRFGNKTCYEIYEVEEAEMRRLEAEEKAAAEREAKERARRAEARRKADSFDDFVDETLERSFGKVNTTTGEVT